MGLKGDIIRGTFSWCWPIRDKEGCFHSVWKEDIEFMDEDQAQAWLS
jgi:hypothetical protein